MAKPPIVGYTENLEPIHSAPFLPPSAESAEDLMKMYAKWCGLRNPKVLTARKGDKIFFKITSTSKSVSFDLMMKKLSTLTLAAKHEGGILYQDLTIVNDKGYIGFLVAAKQMA